MRVDWQAQASPSQQEEAAQKLALTGDAREESDSAWREHQEAHAKLMEERRAQYEREMEAHEKRRVAEWEKEKVEFDEMSKRYRVYSLLLPQDSLCDPTFITEIV